MNAKRVKHMRRSLRELGHPAIEVSYKMMPHPRIKTLTGTVILDPMCGRAMYQAAKREARLA